MGSLNPARGVYQRLGRPVVGDKAAQNFNGKVTLHTKRKKIKDGAMKVKKVHTTLNPADLFTKQVPERTAVGHLTAMGCQTDYDDCRRGT